MNRVWIFLSFFYFVQCVGKNKETEFYKFALESSTKRAFDYTRFCAQGKALGGEIYPDTILSTVSIILGKNEYYVAWDGNKKDIEIFKKEDSILFAWKWDSLEVRNKMLFPLQRKKK